MKKNKFKKIIIVSALIISFIIPINGNIAHAAPAPGLKSIRITDVTVDENNKIYIEITEIGTSRNRYVYCNNTLLNENYNEIIMLDLNHDNIIDGYKRYFYTGYTINRLYSGLQLNISAQYTNAMSPWNTISISNTISFN